jgi:hypothetical protein
VGLKAADFGAHSLRAGFLTSTARRGGSVFKMRDVSRHKRMDVLQAYVRDAELFRGSRGRRIALARGRTRRTLSVAPVAARRPARSGPDRAP